MALFPIGARDDRGAGVPRTLLSSGEAMSDPGEPVHVVPVGGWSGVGAVLGLLFGLMLSANQAVTIVIGTALGLVVGLLVDRRRRSA